MIVVILRKTNVPYSLGLNFDKSKSEYFCHRLKRLTQIKKILLKSFNL
ncbi:hypothetical protein RC62_4267 [Flavobacterium aquidurense]|uniref:Uncharacterized protein n=1 Tax=Flavobacterium aquidurense TaxID=362413 RepID=A0A0Q0SAF8_9FLAO|nr:hypothetical protein RC62_4267 [Flavobacterium aquidurense]